MAGGYQRLSCDTSNPRAVNWAGVASPAMACIRGVAGVDHVSRNGATRRVHVGRVIPTSSPAAVRIRRSIPTVGSTSPASA